jgi:hypothetical protein
VDFDPSAPFEIVGAPTGGFDPNAPFEVVQPAAAPAAPADSLGRRFAMGVGGVISGAIDTLRNPAAAIANIPSVAVNTIAGREVVPEPFRYNLGREIADTAGLPRPVTPTERIVDSAVQGGAGMIGPMGLARAAQAPGAFMQPPRTVGQAVTGAFANNPGTDLAAGAVGGAVGGAIEQAGGNVVGQVAGDVAGNIITAAIIAAVARRRGLMPESVRPESITPEETAAAWRDPDVQRVAEANGITDPTDPRVPQLEGRLDAARAAEAQRGAVAPAVTAEDLRVAREAVEQGADPSTVAPPVRQPVPETVALPDQTAAIPRVQTADGARVSEPPLRGTADPNAVPFDPARLRSEDTAAEQAFRLAEAQRQRATAPNTRDTQPAGVGTTPEGQPVASSARMAQDFMARSGSPDPNLPRQSYRFTPPDPNTEFPGATSGPQRGGPAQGRTPFPDQAEIVPGGTRDAPAPSPEVQRIEAQIGRLTARGEPEAGTPAADQVARLRQTLAQIEGPRRALPAPETPQGQGSPVRAAPREVGGAEGTPLPPAGGAAQEVGAPPRITAEPQQGAPDPSGPAPMARPPEASAANVSPEAPRAVPGGAAGVELRMERGRQTWARGDTSIEYRPGLYGPNNVHIENVETLASARRQGSARAALQDFLRETDARGVNTTLVIEPGDAGVTVAGLRRLYRDLGFRKRSGPTEVWERKPGARNAEAPAADRVAGEPGGRPDATGPAAPRGSEGDAGPADARGPRADGGSGTLYVNPLADPAAWKRFLADPIAGTIRSLRDRLKSSVASIGTTPGVGAFWRLYLDSNRATLLGFQEKYSGVPGMRELVENLGGTDPGSGRRVAAGYQESADATARSLNNRVANVLRPLGDDAESLGRVRDILTGRIPRGATPAERAAAQRLRTMLDAHHEWLSKRLGSVEKEMGYVRGRYFPRRFDAEAIQADLAGFVSDATALYRRMGLDADQARLAADEWANRVMGIGGGARYGDTPSGAFTKGRTLPPDADTLMRKWLVTDPREALSGYFEASTRHAEFVSRFGPNGQKFDDVLKGMRAEGATPTEIDILSRAFASATGTTAAGTNPTTGLLSWTQMWGMRQLLTRALFSSAMEPISVGLRSGNLADSYRALGSTWRRFLTPDSWQGTGMKVDQERAEMLGVIGDAQREMLMAARVESQNLRTRDATRINQMLAITGQNRLFAASRIASSRIAEHTIAKLAGRTDPGARRALAELGMNEADASAVSAWLRRHDGKPPVAELTGDTPAANAYRTAVNRFVNESIVNPLAVDRPVGAGERHPLAQLAYGIMSFQYAFTRNVLIRTIKQSTAALTGGNGMTAGERLTLMVPLAGMGMLAAAQMAMSEARDAAFNRQAARERPPFVDTVLGMDRAGMFGNLSPLVNMVTSAKYERDASGALAGAYLGNMARQVADMTTGRLPEELGGRNSPNTNNAEWAAARAGWGLIAAPAMVGALAAAPIPAWAKPIAGGAAMYVGSSDMSRTVATAVAGERPPPRGAPRGQGLRSSGGIAAGGGISASR